MPSTFPAPSSPWPARLDLLLSASGLALALFMALHMALVASILFGLDAMWTVARFFEGYFVFGRALPGLVALMVAAVFALVVLHAALALRRLPARQHAAFWRHLRGLHHGDTTLWYVQAVTGFLLFFLAPAHLWMLLTHPDLIGPYESADRVWSGRMWLLDLPLLLTVEVHACIGLYRLALKWLGYSDVAGARRWLRRLLWGLIGVSLLLGAASLGAYVRLGIAHEPNAGERYRPVSEVGAEIPPAPLWERGEHRWVRADVSTRAFPLFQRGSEGDLATVAGRAGSEIPPAPLWERGEPRWVRADVSTRAFPLWKRGREGALATVARRAGAGIPPAPLWERGEHRWVCADVSTRAFPLWERGENLTLRNGVTEVAA
ncbi:MAG: fumarate reductase cytochrome b subunit [Betaproteobacteria bacterium]|nr:fumarate reductase cytochrome b subunit [Betaproteobacteria bacterium]